ncbi:MAG: DUF3830 family protein [Candidatus Tectomicrobia bacterium]|nr:DUF3830 family protein [Candidatus Tectomicrobia bacterium]
MSKLILKINDTAMVAVLHEDKAPNTCRALTQLMPLQGHVMQTRWSGEAMWMPLPELTLEMAFENHTCYPAKGELLYYPGFISVREILIPYGASIFGSKVGLLPGNHFATITEGMDALETLGEQAAWEGARPIVIRPADSSEG